MVTPIMYWDCETDGLYRDGNPEPPNIVCAVTLVDGKCTDWRESDVAVFTPETADALAQALISHPGLVCTYNGGGFDFRLLCDHVTTQSLRKKLVKRCIDTHIDIAMDFLSTHGYYTSLDSILKGTGLPCKIWSGAESAVEWRANMEKVVEYCQGDVKSLEKIVTYVEKYGVLSRLTKKEKIQHWTPFAEKRLRTVRECLSSWNSCPVDNAWFTPLPGRAPPNPNASASWVATALR